MQLKQAYVKLYQASYWLVSCKLCTITDFSKHRVILLSMSWCDFLLMYEDCSLCTSLSQ